MRSTGAFDHWEEISRDGSRLRRSTPKGRSAFASRTVPGNTELTCWSTKIGGSVARNSGSLSQQPDLRACDPSKRSGGGCSPFRSRRKLGALPG
jgi:hypothetical protein